MRLKALIATLLVAGFAVSVAVAQPGPRGKTDVTTTTSKGKGSKEQQLLGCKPVVSLVLKGEFVSAGSGSFAMLVKGSNRHAKALKGKQATVTVDDRTKFKRRGKAELADLEAGDRLVARIRACKPKKGEEASEVAMLAKSVVATPKKADKPEGETTGTTTTTG